MNCYPFIEAEKSQRRNVKRACELLKVSGSAVYAARGDEPSERAAQDAALAARVKAVHEESKGRYCSPRVHAQLRAQGRRHSRKRVARLMRQAGLQGRAARRRGARRARSRVPAGRPCPGPRPGRACPARS